jgi:glutamate/tyrosine decarboxylase-like PLP-dependent enzyme
MRFSESGSFALPPEAFGWLSQRRAEEQRAADRLPSSEATARELTRLIKAHPDFELAVPASENQVCFRAAPDGVDDIALNRLNLELQQRVNASGELELGRYQLGDRYFLRLDLETIPGAGADVSRMWDVMGDAFVGILVESADPRMRWRFGGDY